MSRQLFGANEKASAEAEEWGENGEGLGEKTQVGKRSL